MDSPPFNEEDNEVYFSKLRKTPAPKEVGITIVQNFAESASCILLLGIGRQCIEPEEVPHRGATACLSK